MDFKAECDLYQGDSVAIGELTGGAITEYRGLVSTGDGKLAIGVCLSDCEAGSIPEIQLTVKTGALHHACYLHDALNDLSAAAQRFAVTGCPDAHINSAVKTCNRKIAAILKSGRIKV